MGVFGGRGIEGVMNTKEKIRSVLDDVTVLCLFQRFCEKNNDVIAKQRLRNILSRSDDKRKTMKIMFVNEMRADLTDEAAERMRVLVEAFLKKSSYRKSISADTRIRLLKKQHFKCRFCKKDIDRRAHVDHIVPFRLVGDELQDNLQMLCQHCNEAKKASVDYEIKYLLHMNEGEKR